MYRYSTGLVPATQATLQRLGATFLHTGSDVFKQAGLGVVPAWNPADQNPKSPGIDWRMGRSLVGGTSALGPVLNQGDCGSCYMMVILQMMQSWLAIANASPVIVLDPNAFLTCAFKPRTKATPGTYQCAGWDPIEYFSEVVATTCTNTWLATTTTTPKFMFSDKSEPSKECKSLDSCLHTALPWPSCTKFKKEGIYSCSQFIPDWRTCSPQTCVASQSSSNGSFLKKCKLVVRAFGTSLSRAEREKELVQILRLFGPFPVNVTTTDRWTSYSSGIFGDGLLKPYGPMEDEPVDHTVVLVGAVEDAKYGEYWIVMNSWGAEWGYGGFAYIPRNTDEYGKLGAFNILTGPSCYIE